MTAEPLWTVAQVAAFLSMSKHWVYKQVEWTENPAKKPRRRPAPPFPFVRLGANLRFRPEAIRAYALAAAHEASPATPALELLK